MRSVDARNLQFAQRETSLFRAEFASRHAVIQPTPVLPQMEQVGQRPLDRVERV
ncbi:MAG: hypothetical protein LH479_05745 [Polaromonas sp.]|nr:hypothetical protein [Polaromonas sp.]